MWYYHGLKRCIIELASAVIYYNNLYVILRVLNEQRERIHDQLLHNKYTCVYFFLVFVVCECRLGTYL